MSLIILPKYKKILALIDTDKVAELNKFLEYQYDGHITSKNIRDRLNLSLGESKSLLKLLFDLDIIEPNYKIYCDNSCDTNTKEIYECISDIPQEICYGCDKECTLFKNIIVVYKVLEKNLYE